VPIGCELSRRDRQLLEPAAAFEDEGQHDSAGSHREECERVTQSPAELRHVLEAGLGQPFDLIVLALTDQRGVDGQRVLEQRAEGVDATAHRSIVGRPAPGTVLQDPSARCVPCNGVYLSRRRNHPSDADAFTQSGLLFSRQRVVQQTADSGLRAMSGAQGLVSAANLVTTSRQRIARIVRTEIFRRDVGC
jgi:hypothetical protein